MELKKISNCWLDHQKCRLLIWNLRLYFVLLDCDPQGVVQSTYLPINWENSSDPHYLKNVALTNYPHYYYVEIPHTKIPSVGEFY